MTAAGLCAFLASGAMLLAAMSIGRALKRSRQSYQRLDR